MSERKIIILIFILINLLIIFLGRASTIFVNKDVHEFVLHEAEFFAKAVARSIIHDQAKPGKIVFQGNMETLQDYVSSLYEIDSHDIVIVDEDKKILADVISGDVGHLYNYDSNGEVNKTLDDGITRTFIETSREYPQGIKEIVVPLLTKQKKISGALILEYTPLHENANALISPTINAINRLTVIAMIISILPGFFVLRRSSERRKAEAAVKRSKDFLDKILNTLDDPVFVKDEQHSWVLLNDKACQLMGGARDQLLGRSDYDLFPEDQADEFREKDKLVMETGETNINEEQVKWHGNLHTVATKKSLFIDPETGKKYIVGVTRDITEQNRINLLLQESEYRYRCIFDNIKFGIAVYSALDNGKDFVFVDFNKGAEKIENLSREDIIGKSVAEVFPDITGFGLFEVFQRVWRTGVPEHHPVSRYKDNRIWGWRDNYIYKLSNREIVAVYTDETDREETRLALNKSEERFRLMFERSSDGILLIDNGKFIDCNEAAVKLFGFSHKKELLGLEPADLSPEKQPNGSLSSSKADELISKALSSNTLRFEWLHVDKNGKKIPVEALLIPIPLNGGKVLFTLLRDISERTLAQESIKISEANYRALFNSTDDAILVQSSDTGYFIDANQKMIEMFSLSFEEFRFLDQNSISILCNSESSSTKRELDDRFEKAVHGNAQVFELHMRGKNKTPFWVEVHLKCAQINDKSVLLWNFRDISDRKQNQTARKNLEVQLQQAQKMEAIGTLASGIAHDFNNILMAIMGNAEMAQDQLLPGTPENKCIDQIIKGCHRATKLVRQILHFASQSDNVSIPVKVGNIVDEVSNLLRSSLPRNIDILQNVKSERDSVLGVSIQIHQVLMNLCTNAYHAMMEEGGVLEICLENITLPVEKLAMPSKQTPGEYLRLQVRDTGCGMSKETIMRIFDPYFTTKGKDIGTGLGLSVVHGIVQSHGGFINVDSEIGHGTVFNIYFPLIDILAEPESKTGALIPGGKERVLFVDDEESLANLGTRMLHRLGYEVTTRVSPVEALEAFKYKPDGFDLVITDMNMPNMSGVELAVELNCIRSDIPIVLCTGFSETLTESKAREMGISSIIMKPFIMRDLAGIIREVLDEKVI